MSMSPFSAVPTASQYPATNTNPFLAWPFNTPSRPIYSPISYPTAYANASAYAGNIIPSYGTFPYMAGSMNPVSSIYPGYQNFMPQSYANANSYANSGAGNNNQLFQLLFILLAQLRSNGHGNNSGNQAFLTNNGEINPIVKNIIIDPENVNIAGVNAGIQNNTDNEKKYPPTAKDEHGRTGYLCPPGTKGTDGFYKDKEFPPGTYMVPKDPKDHHAHYFMPNAPKGTKDLSGKTADKDGNLDVLQSPLTLDLNGDGKINTTSNTRSDIDIDADGQKDTISQIKDDGLLFIDPNHTGQITSGTQLLGNHTNGKNYTNGFDALKDVAQETLGAQAVADGKLDADEIKQLEEKTGLGIEVNGQMKSLEDLGVTELNLDYNNTQQGDAFGNQVLQSASAIKDGKQIGFDDLWFKKQ